jgi:hypothetical protein
VGAGVEQVGIARHSFDQGVVTDRHPGDLHRLPCASAVEEAPAAATVAALGNAGTSVGGEQTLRVGGIDDDPPDEAVTDLGGS